MEAALAEVEAQGATEEQEETEEQEVEEQEVEEIRLAQSRLQGSSTCSNPQEYGAQAKIWTYAWPDRVVEGFRETSQRWQNE